MSRLKKYARSLISGYALLAANVVFTLASVPLALSYLSTAEFGLWALTSQVAGYLALVDFGMSGALSRILIDYKDEREGTNYGSVLQTGFLVGLAQGFLLLIFGTATVFLLQPLLDVPEGLSQQFQWLMLGQCGLMAAAFSIRIFSTLLWAHQRSDVANYSQLVLFGVHYGVLWFCFDQGAGVYSMLWGQAAGTACGAMVAVIASLKLRFLPSAGRWGRPTWARFRELFGFGKDVFLFTLGSQMVNTSQTILVTPLLGIEAAGVWAVCVRTYSLVCQVVWRVLDFSATPLSEMLVRGERARFFERFRAVTVLTGAMGMVAAVLFAAGNQTFVEVWTNGKVSWSAWNDVMLGVWSVLMAVQRCHNGLQGVTKTLGRVKYVYFFEGLLFIGLAVLVTKRLGPAGVILSSLVATCCVSFPFGLLQTRTMFHLSWNEVIDWLKPAGRIASVLIPLMIVTWWGSKDFPAPARLAVVGGIGITAGGWLLIRYGLEPSLQQQLLSRLPRWMKTLVTGISGVPRATG